MTGTHLKQTLKVWMLPIAMLVGIVFHNAIRIFAPLSPYLIGIMLFITYCRINTKELTISRLSGALLLIQIGVSIILYLILREFNALLAQTVFICIFCPTATAAPVITAMLGGSINKLISYSFISNLSVAILAPVLFSYIGASDGSQMGFLKITWLISLKVIPLIIGPLVLALLLHKFSPQLHQKISKQQSLSFYIWALSLIIVVGNAVSYVISHLAENSNDAAIMIGLALCSLLTCVFQFITGRKIGAVCGDKVAGAQGLGQKNTVLAIWMCLTFLNPLSSVGPAAYVAWQNTINSLQIWLKSHKSMISQIN